MARDNETPGVDICWGCDEPKMRCSCDQEPPEKVEQEDADDWYDPDETGAYSPRRRIKI